MKILLNLILTICLLAGWIIPAAMIVGIVAAGVPVGWIHVRAVIDIGDADDSRRLRCNLLSDYAFWGHGSGLAVWAVAISTGPASLAVILGIVAIANPILAARALSRLTRRLAAEPLDAIRS